MGPGRRGPGEATSSYFVDSQVEPVDFSSRAGLQIVTVNANSHGTLMRYLNTSEADVIFAQETHAMYCKLPEVQADALDMGWRGQWLAAEPTPDGGSEGGVAVLTRTNIQCTQAPFLQRGEIVAGRAVAGLVQAGRPGGLVCISIYLATAEGRSPRNLAILWEVWKYVKRVTAEGYAWIIAGDFNMPPEELLASNWLHLITGACVATTEATCLQSQPGRVLDYFIVHKSLSDATSFNIDVLIDSSVWPHQPVRLQLPKGRMPLEKRLLKQPRNFPKVARPGCARFPWNWQPTLALIQKAQGLEQLALAWDSVLIGIEWELANRHDYVGGQRQAYEGRAGPPELVLEAVAWSPSRRRTRHGKQASAWAMAARWATHMQSV